MKKGLLRAILLLAAGVLCACGKSDVTGNVTNTPVPTETQSFSPTVSAVTPIPGGDPDEILIDNIYFRKIAVGEKTDRVFTLVRADGSELTLYLTEILLNGEPYPYACTLLNEDGGFVYGMYTEERADGTYLYERQCSETAEPRLIGLRGKYYCPWVSASESDPGEELEQFSAFLETLRNINEGRDEELSFACRYPLGNESAVIVGIDSVRILFSGGNTIPGTLLSEEQFDEVIKANMYGGEIIVDLTGPRSETIRTVYGDYTLTRNGSEQVLTDEQGNVLCVLTEDTARWNDTEYFVTSGYGEPKIGELDWSEFFEYFTDPNPPKRDEREASWLRTAGKEDLLSEWHLTDFIRQSSYRDARFRFEKAERFLFDYRDGDMIDSYGDAYVLTGAVSGDRIPATGDCRIGGFGYLENGGPNGAYREWRLGDLLITRYDEEDRETEIRLGSFVSGARVTAKVSLSGYPKNLYRSMGWDSKGDQYDVYIADNFELARVNTIYTGNGNYSVPGGRPCAEYLYIAGELCGKTVFFYHPDRPEIAVVCEQDGGMRFYISDLR